MAAEDALGTSRPTPMPKSGSGAPPTGAKTGNTVVNGDSVEVIAALAGAYALIGAGSGILGSTLDFGSASPRRQSMPRQVA
ncbi:MAG: hypothetical protein R3F31_03720 [Verrucomicrobiales bacterium]